MHVDPHYTLIGVVIFLSMTLSEIVKVVINNRFNKNGNGKCKIDKTTEKKLDELYNMHNVRDASGRPLWWGDREHERIMLLKLDKIIDALALLTTSHERLADQMEKVTDGNFYNGKN